MSLAAPAATIVTSGTLIGYYGIGDQNVTEGGPPRRTLNIAGSNFSLFFQAEVNPFPLGLPVCPLAEVCNYNFTQNPSFSGQTSGDVTQLRNFRLVYGGVTYTSTSDFLSISLAFTGQTVSAPDVLTTPGCNALNNCIHVSTSTPAPFTMTGSFTLSDGTTILASDTLSGSGLSDFYVYDDFNGAGSRVTYAFASTPEPSSIGLVGVGLLFAVWLARRRFAIGI